MCTRRPRGKGSTIIFFVSSYAVSGFGLSPMADNDVRICTTVTERLKGQKGIIFLLGWKEKKTIYCIGCAACNEWKEQKNEEAFRSDIEKTIALFPEGIRVVGLYEDCPEGLASLRCRQLLDRLLDYELEDVIAGSQLVFLHNILSGDVKQFVLLYDSQSKDSTLRTLTVVRDLYTKFEPISLRVTGNVAISFEYSEEYEKLSWNVSQAFECIKTKISDLSVYHLKNSQVLLSTLEERFDHQKLYNNDCLKLFPLINGALEGDDGFQNSKSKKKQLAMNKWLFFRLTLLATGKEAINHTIACAPVIRYERRDFMNVVMSVDIDALAAVSSSHAIKSLPSILTNCIHKQLSEMENVLLSFYKETHQFLVPKVYHFSLPFCSPLLSVIYPSKLSDTELESQRRQLHRRVLLPLDRPLLRKSMTYKFPSEDSSGYLYSVHIGLPTSGVSDGQVTLVQGTYAYHHYMQDRVDDNGWGCAYRSLQTLISWFVIQGYAHCNIPTHSEIQQCLVDMGDKPSSFVNSKKWIGSLEVSYCLNKLIGIDSKIIFVSSGADLASKGRELVNHFLSQGTPIMIGGGVLAHTILGVHANFLTGDIKFLILDPHYTGSEDLAVIQGKGWCGWKGPDFWDKTAYYNLCCPQRPSGI